MSTESISLFRLTKPVLLSTIKSKSPLLSLVIAFILLKLLLKLNALPVLVKLLSGVTAIVVPLLEPKLILPAAKSAGPVYVITPVPELYPNEPNPPASVTLTSPLISLSAGPVYVITPDVLCVSFPIFRPTS